MDTVDRKILNLIQEAFPLTPRPFAEIGKETGITEKEALERVQRLKEDGYIRRIGPVLEPKKLVYTSTLCGVHVKEEILLEAVKEINRHKGVTHNYERDGKLNLWFTITAKSTEEIDTFISGLEEKFSLKIYRFPKKRVFKIKTFFPL
jgi:siroheme decarboxylase